MQTYQQGGTSDARYTRVAITLHWAIAFFIILNLSTGFFLDRLPPPVTLLHISSGITVLALTALRVVWRLTHPRPSYPAEYSPWERRLADIVHFCLYAFMIGMPLTGWALISANPPLDSPGAAVDAQQLARIGQHSHAGGNPPIWLLIPLPYIAPIHEMGRDPAGLPAQRVAHDRFDTVHKLGAFSLLTLLLLHLSGALKHQFVDKQRELARMGIGRRRPQFR
ncbi:cytochrome b [Sphingomonas bacterium]|uniref:cytochrome b n=1 Tax=Sphingomonas bacterium TaxID=1895847 RepID=UPI001575C8CF|nr:cytochrome b/b6 domain-containing protein [Sphingomonas bacterium]